LLWLFGGLNNWSRIFLLLLLLLLLLVARSLRLGGQPRLLHGFNRSLGAICLRILLRRRRSLISAGSRVPQAGVRARRWKFGGGDARRGGDGLLRAGEVNGPFWRRGSGGASEVNLDLGGLSFNHWRQW
jgi:hypothetical protein